MIDQKLKLALRWPAEWPGPDVGSAGEVAIPYGGVVGTFVVTGCWEINSWRVDQFMMSVEITLHDGAVYRGRGARPDLLSSARVYQRVPEPTPPPPGLAAESEMRI